MKSIFIESPYLIAKKIFVDYQRQVFRCKMQLDFGFKLTVVSILCHKMASCTIKHLNYC